MRRQAASRGLVRGGQRWLPTRVVDSTLDIFKQGVVCCSNTAGVWSKGHASVALPLLRLHINKAVRSRCHKRKVSQLFLLCRTAASVRLRRRSLYDRMSHARTCTHTPHASAQTPRGRINLSKKNLTKPAHICERTSACSEPYLCRQPPTPTPQPTCGVTQEDPNLTCIWRESHNMADNFISCRRAACLSACLRHLVALSLFSLFVLGASPRKKV